MRKKFLGSIVLPFVVFAFLLPLLGIVNFGGATLFGYLAAAGFTAFPYFVLRLNVWQKLRKGPTPNVVLKEFIAKVSVTFVGGVLAALIVPSVSIANYIGLLVVVVLYPFVEERVAGE